MIKVGKWIAKHKILIIIIGIILLIPSYLGMAATRINYDVLSYLPETLETVRGPGYHGRPVRNGSVLHDRRGGYGPAKDAQLALKETIKSSRSCRESALV